MCKTEIVQNPFQSHAVLDLSAKLHSTFKIWQEHTSKLPHCFATQSTVQHDMVFYPRSHSSMYVCSKICRIGDVWSVSAPRLYALSLRGAIVRFCTKKLQTFTSPCITSFQRSRTSSERWLCISTGNVAPTDRNGTENSHWVYTVLFCGSVQRGQGGHYEWRSIMVPEVVHLSRSNGHHIRPNEHHTVMVRLCWKKLTVCLCDAKLADQHNTTHNFQSTPYSFAQI